MKVIDPQKWLRSILEINTPEWSVDQWNQGNEKYLDRAGGFFDAYVVFNLLLLVGLTIREQLHNRKLSENQSRNAITALITMALVSLIPANFPQSHELRYFMFWMITLVSLNLSLVSSWHRRQTWLQPQYVGLIYLLFLAIVCSRIKSYYFKPDFRTLERFLTNNTKQELVEQMIPNKRTCMIARHAIPEPDAVPFASIQNAFYYSAYFHPEIKYDYSIKATVDPRDCGELKMIPPNAAEFIKSQN